MQLYINDERYNEPTWEMIEMAFNRLLANEADTIGLGKDDFDGLLASGEGDLVTIAYFGYRTEACLMNPEPKGIEYKMMVGTQYVEITDDILVSKETGIRVFKLYFEGQDILTAENLKWS